MLKQASLLLALAGCAPAAPRSEPVPAPAPAREVTVAEPAIAGPKHMLFRVTGTTPGAASVYILGSVHLLSEDAATLPTVVDSAFARATTVAFETSLDSIQSRAMELLGRATLPPGTTLRDVLSDSVYRALEVGVPQYGVNLQQLSRFKPWMVSLVLTQATVARAKFRPELGVDMQLHRRAKDAGKRIVGLESVDFQLGLFDSISPADQELMLSSQMITPDSAVRGLLALKDAWMAGDTATIGREMLKSLAKSPALLDLMLGARNRSWLPPIEGLLAGRGDALVVVGAAHLVGPDGVLDLLRRKGYRIVQL